MVRSRSDLDVADVKRGKTRENAGHDSRWVLVLYLIGFEDHAWFLDQLCRC